MAVATTVATVAAVTSIVAAGVGAGMSFSDAASAKNAQKASEDRAKQLMEDAKRKLEKDHFEGLGIPLDAFEKQNEVTVALQQQAIAGLSEAGQRAIAAGVGKVGAVGSASAEATRVDMASALHDLDKIKADSKESVKQDLAMLDVGQALDASARAADAATTRSLAIQQGFSAVGQVAQGVSDLTPLYQKGSEGRWGEKLAEKHFNKTGINTGVEGVDMNKDQLAAYYQSLGLDRKKYKSIFDSESIYTVGMQSFFDKNYKQ